MHDFFPLAPIPWLSRAIEPLTDKLGWTTLPLHIHEVLFSFLLYTFIDLYAAPRISTWLFPVKYPQLSADKRKNWNVHVVSLAQSTLVNSLALYVMFYDEERKQMDWQQRVWGYTGAMGLVQGFAAGYFLWDLMITIRHWHLFGIGMLAHAICALIVYFSAFRPVTNFYGCTFILYELSSPFLNFHWFFDKLGMTGSRAQLVNGIVLLFTFFSCRLVWGTYHSIKLYQDLWTAIRHTPLTADIHPEAMYKDTPGSREALAGRSAAPIHSNVMRFARDEYVPIWLAVAVAGSNVVLNTLNYVWFRKMIQTLQRRFQSTTGDSKKEAPVVTRSTGIDGKVKIGVDDTEVRHRRTAVEVEDVPPT